MSKLEKILFYITLIKIVLLKKFLKEEEEEKLIDISPYNYPKPIDKEDEYNIAILGTNDIHGSYFPLDNNIKNETYKSGGLEYLGKYINILRDEWKERFLWFDIGDQFQGGLENKLSNCSIITDFFNIMKLDAATIGNHEWDFEREFIEKRMNESNFKYIVSNIEEISTHKKEFLPNQIRYQILSAGKIKIGLIGLTTLFTKSTSFSKDVKNINFLNYIDTIQEISQILRPKTNVIILLPHLGITCPNQTNEEKYTLKLIDKETKFSKCYENEELYILLKNLPKGLIDVVVFGHTHETYHQWLFDYPLISSINNGKYANIMYLSFKLNTKGEYEYNNDKTIIEGPIPICEKIFDKTLHCRAIKENEISKQGKLKYYKFHNVKITSEESLRELSKKWEVKLEEIKKDIIIKSEEILKHEKKKAESVLGNLFASMIQIITKSDFSIVNSGGFRSEWPKGNISRANFESMFPFSNQIVSFKIDGKNAKKLMKIIQNGDFSFYVTSGLKQISIVNNNIKKLVNIKLFDGVTEKEFDDEKIYTIGTLDFLIFGGDDFGKVIKWYNIKEVKYFGDMKDISIDFLKKMGVIVSKYWYDIRNPRMKIININNRN